GRWSRSGPDGRGAAGHGAPPADADALGQPGERTRRPVRQRDDPRQRPRPDRPRRASHRRTPPSAVGISPWGPVARCVTGPHAFRRHLTAGSLTRSGLPEAFVRGTDIGGYGGSSPREISACWAPDKMAPSAIG